ncbi:short-chain dehydrogenase/reductase SDR [Caldithrix abyssi DSM 13497]|uniref:NAD(P)-dependent dehydrogenase, short-chain alcohol dehydrogenase family n=1 Tax=Caldithrix abyssi DSM 13497 TaxID=880073 RepID=H1XW61_CALAY|nr:SDR family oxidoreductase [Caldithrix abyssi]APF19018.1 NAD(P)-dependent dehydrogenase, short-chain alcohol dehydrogenase family [Caldithrix abyssi DSM 13497]EHO42966.1 short-chain dehydrogenase/reductase SDR [Caldithrix abyssi DSM 13497]
MANQSALITGAARGIGKCIAYTLLKNDFTVGLMDMDGENLALTLKDFSTPGKAFAYHGDVGDENFVKKTIVHFTQQTGRINAVINNAAIAINKDIASLSLEEWRRVIETNLTSAFLMVKHASPYLKQSRGSIINIASTRALMSEAHTEAYSASKGGLLSLTHALAISLGPEVKVNAISPGWIDTRYWVNKDPADFPPLDEQDHAQHPAGRVGRPEDIASMVLYLLRPENDFITGANFVIDGGMTRKMIYAE